MDIKKFTNFGGYFSLEIWQLLIKYSETDGN